MANVFSLKKILYKDMVIIPPFSKDEHNFYVANECLFLLKDAQVDKSAETLDMSSLYEFKVSGNTIVIDEL